MGNPDMICSIKKKKKKKKNQLVMGVCGRPSDGAPWWRIGPQCSITRTDLGNEETCNTTPLNTPYYNTNKAFQALSRHITIMLGEFMQGFQVMKWDP